jgi:hypothetical protein
MDALIDDLPYAVDNVVVPLASFWSITGGKDRPRG